VSDTTLFRRIGQIEGQNQQFILRYFVAHLLEPISYFIYSIALVYWTSKDKRGIIKIISGYYFIAGLFMVKATLTLGTGKTNIQVYSLLCVISSFGLGSYFYSILLSWWHRVFVLIFCVLNGAYYIFNNLIQEGQPVFDSMAYVILSSTLVIPMFMFMHQLLSQVKEEPLSMNFDFWFVSSQFLYFVSSFAIFLTFGYMTNKVITNDVLPIYTSTLTRLWGVHNVLLFLSALLTSGGILWISYRMKSP
jgi:hypothetical protein